MTKTTCDHCGAEFDPGVNPGLESVHFNLGEFRFFAALNDMKLIRQFNTTNKHFCRSCLTVGLASELGKIADGYNGKAAKP